MPATLETERLTLRPYARTDRDDAVRLHSDPVVSRYMGDGTPGDGEALFHAIFGIYNADEPRFFEIWAVEADGRFVGHAELKQTEHTTEGELELVYCLVPEAWGKGYGTALVGALTGRAESVGCRTIATVHPDNAASLHILHRWSFAEVERFADGTVLLRR
ncbi:MAG: N-acetyltransferase [Deltaproteobacteria bacterium]|nr:MAG: N-acetyltransferase [Deltaproteobacteria bacterium]